MCLWYRVVLQVILIEKYHDNFDQEDFNNNTVQVGRKLINNEKKMPTFVEYVRKALNKLNLENERVKNFFRFCP